MRLISFFSSKIRHDSEAVTHIFRLVHTIKGTAGFLALVRLQTISHAAETLIDTLRNGAPPTATAVSLLLQAMDRIKLLIVKVGELEQEPEGDDRDIIGRIEDYLQGGQEEPGASAEEPKPAAAEPKPEEAKPKPDAANPQKSKRRPGKRKRAKQQQVGENSTASVPATTAASEPSKPEPDRINRAR